MRNNLTVGRKQGKMRTDFDPTLNIKSRVKSVGKASIPSQETGVTKGDCIVLVRGLAANAVLDTALQTSMNDHATPTQRKLNAERKGRTFRKRAIYRYSGRAKKTPLMNLVEAHLCNSEALTQNVVVEKAFLHNVSLANIEAFVAAIRKLVDVKSTIAVALPDIGEIATAEAPGKGDRLNSVLESARQRGSATVAEILKGSDMLSSEQIASRLGTSRETVNAKRKAHEMLGLVGPTRGFRYPSWQVGEDGALLPGLPALFAELGQPWTVYRFLKTKHGECQGKTGLDALWAGDLEAVLEAAKNQKCGAYA